MTRTPDLLGALGRPDGVELLLELIGKGGRVGELSSASGVPQPTATHRLAELQGLGLVAHGRRGSPFEVTDSDAVCDLLRHASEVAERLPGADPKAERKFRKRLLSSGCGSKED